MLDSSTGFFKLQFQPCFVQASIADESQSSSGRLVAARVAALEASHQAEVNELKRVAYMQLA